MDLRVFVEPHLGASHETLLIFATEAEESGFGGFFCSDHYLSEGEGAGLPGPTDAWLTLATVAQATNRIRLGTLVSPITFRLPGPMAICVAAVDTISSGRVELGLGAGWYEAEHRAYGIPFPPTVERFGRLEEQLQIIPGLWRTPIGTRFSFRGRYYSLTDSPALPKPAQPSGPPLIVGGRGAVRTPMLAARYASELNVPFADAGLTRQRFLQCEASCERVGRDPGEIVRSVSVTICCGENRADIERRLGVVMQHRASFHTAPLRGLPQDVAGQLEDYRAAGAERVYLQFLDLTDLDHLRLVASELL
jgi:F420-dependent oxidoreductase-like protein